MKENMELIKAHIFIDAGHLHYHLFDEGWRIDYKKLIEYFTQRYYFPLMVFFYEGMLTKQSYFHKHPEATLEEFNKAKEKKKGYFGLLRSFGFIVRWKPVHRYFNFQSQKYEFKCNFDVELAIDAVETVLTRETDTFIICSGDGDFERLVRFLKGKGKRVIVTSFKRSLNQALLETAHEVIYLEAIKHKIERQ